MSELFTHIDLPFWNLVVRAAVVYLAVVLLLRVSGKKQVGQMGAIELATILLISNAVQNSMNGGDNSLGGGLILASTLVALGVLLAYLTYRSRWARFVFEGTPRLLVHNGKIIPKALCDEYLTKEDLSIMMRKQGVHRVAEVKTAILETDGSLSLIRIGE
ncbi:MAG: DUF421 domain-containing protein [Bdellovibrionales bacterium]|nr:DUF421 domain-containing protein [Bdellovibrionales bacterium]